MYQLTFSEQSMFEIKKLDPEYQMVFIDKLSNLTEADIVNEKANKFERNGKTFIRFKIDEYRVYVEKISSDTLSCHYIIPQHTFSDFLFRANLPVTEEQMIENNTSFWKYLESLKK